MDDGKGVSRRTVIRSLSVVALGAGVAGCSDGDDEQSTSTETATETETEVMGLGPRAQSAPDLIVDSCLDGDTTAEVQIRPEGSNDLIFDETVTVPGESCSDVVSEVEVDGVNREDVFSEAGTYTVAVTVDGYDPVEQQVEFSEQKIEEDSDNVVVTIREDKIEIVV